MAMAMIPGGVDGWHYSPAWATDPGSFVSVSPLITFLPLSEKDGLYFHDSLVGRLSLQRTSFFPFPIGYH